jgi:hypothetical protein
MVQQKQRLIYAVAFMMPRTFLAYRTCLGILNRVFLDESSKLMSSAYLSRRFGCGVGDHRDKSQEW